VTRRRSKPVLVKSLDAYGRGRSSHQQIHEKFSRLRAGTLTAADDLPIRNPGEILKSTLERFKSEGKI